MKKGLLLLLSIVLACGPLLVPRGASAAGLAFTSVSSQLATSLALDSEGGIWAWGSNQNGQFGDGTRWSSAEPLRIEVLDHGLPVAFRDVRTGFDHSVALDSDGKIWTTGHNGDGQLGQGHFNASLSWGKLAVTDGAAEVSFTAIAAGRGATYALDESGKVWGWGFRIDNALAQSTANPTKLDITEGGSPVEFQSIAADDEQAVAIDKNNHVWQIILSGSQREKFNLTDGGATPAFQAVAVGTGYGSGGFLALALDMDGGIWIWGSNEYGQHGDGGAGSETTWSPEKLTVMDGSSRVAFSKISGGNHHVLALDTNGNLWAWGKNDQGQLGDGTTAGTGPVKVAAEDNGGPVPFTSVTAGYERSYALDAEGRIWAWGYPHGSTPSRLPLAMSPSLILGVSQPSSTYLEEITLTATVSGDWGTPTGTVEFRDGTSVLGSQPLSGGMAELNLSTLSAGTHDLSVHYGGDHTYAAGVSEPMTYTVYMPSAPAVVLTPATTADTFDPVTVSVDVQIDGAGNALASLKWLAGSRSAADFAGAGTDMMAESSFEAASSGIYTVYARDAAGSETVETIELTNILEAGDAASLMSAIADAAQALADHPEGTGVGEAAAADREALEAAVAAAQAVADQAASRTQEQLDSARSALEAATAVFRAAVIGAGDAAGLQGAIADAGQALADHPEGTGVGEAAAADREALEAAVAAAQAVADQAASYTQEQLDSARSALEAATAAFRLAVIGLVLTPPDDGLYGTGSVLAFVLTYREAVTVTGTPRLGITLGTGAEADTVYAVYTGSTGESGTALHFTYEVPAGLSDLNGIGLDAQLSLPDGANIVHSGSGEPAVTAFAIPDTSGVRVASVAPALELGTGGTAGRTAEITVTASAHGSEAGNTLTHLRWLPGSRAAADFNSGADGEELSAEGSFAVSENRDYTVYARDAAGNEAVRTIMISSIVRPVYPQPIYLPPAETDDEPDEIEEPQEQTYKLQLASGSETLEMEWTRQDMTGSLHELDGRVLTSGVDAAWTLTLPQATAAALLRENQDSMLQVYTSLGDYLLPAALLRKLEAQPYDEVRVTLSLGSASERRALQEAAAALGAEVHGQPLYLKISTVMAGSEQMWDDFDHAVTLTTQPPAMLSEGQQFVARYEPVRGGFTFVPAALGEHHWTWRARSGGIYAALSYDKQFADMQGSWAAEAVHRLASLLIVNGVDGENYAPNASITRAELTAIVVRALGLATAAADQIVFDDVDTSSWYAGSLAAAVREGLVQGDADGGFRPDAPISRQEAAALLWRVQQRAGITTAAGAADVLAAFADSDRIAPWARGILADAVRGGLLQGDPEGRLQPQADLSRAEAAVMLVRLLDQTAATAF